MGEGRSRGGGTVLSLVVAGAAGILFTGVFVQIAQHAGWGKAIRSQGPQSHLAKSGTPTMAGVAFLAAAVLVWWAFGGAATSTETALVLLVIGSGLLGLFDDWLGLARKRRQVQGRASEESGGLGARYRLLVQGLPALVFSWWAVGSGSTLLGPGWLDVIAYAFVIVGTINAFNFTDGLDGLAAGVTAIVLLFFIGSPFAAALLGALLGFLWYNGHPARAIMGGVGAEALGAAVAGLAILQGTVWYLPLVAAIPVLEVLSVIVQVAYFRRTGGKRLLRMSPLHHHFELSGWSETRVVTRFYLVTAFCVALAFAIRQVPA